MPFGRFEDEVTGERRDGSDVSEHARGVKENSESGRRERVV